MKFKLLFTFMLVFSYISRGQTYIELVNQGNRFTEEKKYSEAINKYEQAILVDSTKPDAFYKIGFIYSVICYEKNKLCVESIRCFKKVNSIEPNYKKTDFNLGVCYLAIEKYDEAILYFTNSILVNKCTGEALFNRGFAYYSLGKLEKACTDFKNAILAGNKNAQKYLKDCK